MVPQLEIKYFIPGGVFSQRRWNKDCVWLN